MWGMNMQGRRGVTCKRSILEAAVARAAVLSATLVKRRAVWAVSSLTVEASSLRFLRGGVRIQRLYGEDNSMERVLDQCPGKQFLPTANHPDLLITAMVSSRAETDAPSSLVVVSWMSRIWTRT